MMDFIENITNSVKFTQRAAPVPLGSRTSYRIAQICLIMGLCCNSKESCSMQKIQTISNAMFKPIEFENIIRYAKDRSLFLSFTPRIDPCVNAAVEFALKYGLCSQATTNRKYKLTALGRKYVAAIYTDDVMQREKEMLMKLGTSFTEDIISEICT